MRAIASRTIALSPGLIKIRDDLFQDSLPTFRHFAQRVLPGTRFLFPSRDPIPTSIFVPRLNLLPAVSRSQLGILSLLSFPRPSYLPTLFVHPRTPPARLPSVFDAPIAESCLVGRIYWSFRPRTPPAGYCTTNRFSALSRFFSFRSFLSFCPFSVLMPRDFSFVPVDRLVRDNELVAQL